MSPGDFITENIRLDAPLGSGGMGSVWTAFHLGLGTPIAVKFVAQGASPDAFARFRREARLAASARHANVVQILDYGVARNGQPYIGMELLEGHDLGHWLQAAGGRLPLTQVATILRQACQGIGRAHSKGIVHRDIKPENLFLCDEEDTIHLKILDFGVARGPLGLSAGQLATNGLIGTACYMSPEQIMSGLGPVDFRTDLWALAVVCYVALTGSYPFDGNSIGALALSIDSCRFAAPSKLVSDLPKAIDAWMTRALSRDPADRYQSARELSREFDRAAGISANHNEGDVDVPSERGSAAPSSPALFATTQNAGREARSPSDAETIHAPGVVYSVNPRPKQRWILGAAAGCLVALGAYGTRLLLAPAEMRPANAPEQPKRALASEAPPVAGSTNGEPMRLAAPSPPPLSSERPTPATPRSPNLPPPSKTSPNGKAAAPKGARPRPTDPEPPSPQEAREPVARSTSGLEMELQ